MHPLFAITALQVTNGTLRYRDLKNGGDLIVAQIQLTVSDLATDEAIEIDLAAAVMTAKPNLKFTSRIGPIAGIRDYRDYPIDGALDAQQLDLGKVNRALPQMRRALRQTSTLRRHLRHQGSQVQRDIEQPIAQGRGEWHGCLVSLRIANADHPRNPSPEVGSQASGPAKSCRATTILRPALIAASKARPMWWMRLCAADQPSSQ